MMSDFRREERYFIFKDKDIDRYLSRGQKHYLYNLLEQVYLGRRMDNREPLMCVVVESDWPEYEPTWEAIERRVLAEDKDNE